MIKNSCNRKLQTRDNIVVMTGMNDKDKCVRFSVDIGGVKIKAKYFCSSNNSLKIQNNSNFKINAIRDNMHAIFYTVVK